MVVLGYNHFIQHVYDIVLIFNFFNNIHECANYKKDNLHKFA